MAIQVLGSTGTVTEVDATFQAARTTLRPPQSINWNTLASVSGLTAGITAGSTVFSFRNAGSTLILVNRVRFSATTSTAFSAAQGIQYNLLKATAWTGTDSGGTQLYTVAGQNKHRTSMTNPATNPGIFIASTAAVTAGTRTVESVPIATAYAWSSAVGPSIPMTDLFLTDSMDYPFVLAQNEGLVMTNAILQGAGGAVVITVQIEWAEVTSY